MMAESQNIEYKESWRDEYLKWICGFANAQGGKIYIGKKDDGMYISNSCLLPFGWTAETLMGSHPSKPFNPDIANVFYRAGYIESWGRGIQKICGACKNIGADEPEYIVHGEDVMVKFHALQSAKVPDSKLPNGSLDGSLEDEILKLIHSNQSLTASEMAKRLKVGLKTAYRVLDKLKNDGKIERIGGKRYGHWEIHD